MSKQEQEIIEQIAKLPPELQDKFLERIQGATMAMDVLKPQPQPSEPRA